MCQYNISQYELREIALSALQVVFKDPERIILLQADEVGLCHIIADQIKHEMGEFERIRPKFKKLITSQKSTEEKSLFETYKSKYGISIPERTDFKEINIEKSSDIEKLIISYGNGSIHLVLDPNNHLDIKKLKEAEIEIYLIEIAEILPYLVKKDH